MRVAGVPLWALVLVACVAAPLLIRAWIDAEHRRAKKRTAALLQEIKRSGDPIDHGANVDPSASMGGRN
jgi:hypothetical protein